MKYEKVLIFATGTLLGAGLAIAVNTGAARKAAVKLVTKGIALKENVAASLECAKESVQDLAAEARSLQNCCDCEKENGAV